MYTDLHKRLTAICTSITASILVVVAVVSLYAAEKQFRQSGYEDFISSVNAILYSVGQQNSISHTWLSQTESNNKVMISIEDKGNPILFNGRGDHLEKEYLIATAKQIAKEDFAFDIEDIDEKSGTKTQKSMFEFEDENGQQYYATAAMVSLRGGKVGMIIVKSVKDVADQILYLRCLVVGMLIIAILCLWIFAWIFTKRAIAPIEESRRSQMEFVAAASHELRSPLAVIQSSISAMEYADAQQEERFKAVITDECMRVSRLVSDMLSLAGADSGRWSVERTLTDLDTLILTCSERYEASAHRKNIRIGVSLPAQALPKCNCDKHRIQQVLSILLDNAISYTQAGGQIAISARLIPSMVQIRVADNGIGISQENKTKIFDRFYRADKARTQKEHYGLGLSIAKEIMSLHGGKISVQDTKGGGSTFIVELPISPKSKR